jgi:alcohol dehydrogenase
MYIMNQFNFYLPTRILSGKGSLAKLRKQRMPGKKALIVISSGKSTRANGYLERVEEELHAAGVETVVFDGVMANPVVANVEAGAKTARDNGCDFIVGLGGGSSIDAAKSIAVMATNDGKYWDYIYGGTGGSQKMKRDPLPLIAIPTTAGTGTEADPWTVISNEETNEKMALGNDKTFPVLAIVDPDLMMTVPPKFTAYQGFDALFHSTEGYIATKANLMSDLFALKAIQAVGQNLAAAYADGSNEAAREQVAFGSTLSGVVMCVGSTTSEHALEHPMSAHHPELPHGAGLIMISLAYYTHFVKNAPQLKDRFIDMAKAMGKADAKDPMDFIEALAELQKACNVYGLKMSDYGIRREELPDFVKDAKATMAGAFRMDAAPLSDEDCLAIYEASYQ